VSEIATTKEAAAAVVAQLLGQPGQDPVQVESAPPVVEAEAPVVSEQPAAEPEAPVEAAPVAPLNLNPELPDDIAAELAEAEIDEQVDHEVAAYVYQPSLDEYGNPIEIDEEAVREAVKLRKRNEYLEAQLVKTKRSQWVSEAEKYFPLSKHALEDLKATSRRSFLAAAKAEHQRILPHVQAYLAEAKQAVVGERAAVTDDARAAVAESWGQPLVDPSSALSAPAVQREAAIQSAREKVRAGGPIRNLFAEMLRNG
jgi:hypothetical protein